MAGGAARRSAAGHAAKAGTNISGAGGLNPREAWGLGVYSVFRHPDVTLTRAIEVPDRPTVRFHDMITVALDNLGEITHVINDTGAAATPKPRVTPKVTSYP